LTPLHKLFWAVGESKRLFGRLAEEPWTVAPVVDPRKSRPGWEADQEGASVRRDHRAALGARRVGQSRSARLTVAHSRLKYSFAFAGLELFERASTVQAIVAVHKES
jgi:hypothetical protein